MTPATDPQNMFQATTITVRSKNRRLADQAVALLADEHPMTLRQLYYRLVSAGELANRQAEYQRLGVLMTRLREAGDIPRTWIVDHVRSRLKPSSWTGLADFADTVREAYRKDFWSSLPHHVEVLVEKDAVAGTIQPITNQYDIALQVCRGYSSVSFAGEIADQWSQIEKPIFAYYLGDFDPSGFDLERDLREKLSRYSDRFIWPYENGQEPTYLDGSEGGRYVCWVRLGVTLADFEDHDLIRLPVKHTDNRARAFIAKHGDDCAEIDAIPPNELRRRVQEAIERHIDHKQWKKLERVERAEQETLEQFVSAFPK